MVEPLKKRRLHTSSIRLTIPGSYRFQATGPGGLLCEQTLWIDESTKNLRLILEPGQSITGTVVDEELGHPMKSVNVELEEPGSDDPLKVQTDAAGRFGFESLNAKARDLKFEHHLYDSHTLRGVLPGSDLVVALRPLERRDLRGRVLVRGSELPITGATIQLGRQMQTRGRSREGGRFLLQDVAKKAREIVWVSAPGHMSLRTEIEAEDDEIDFLLTPDSEEERRAAGLTALIRGRVLDAQGEPAPLVDIRLEIDRSTTALPSGWRASSPGVKRRAGLFNPPSVATTDASGMFVLESVHTGLAEIGPRNNRGEGQTLHLQLGRSYEGLLIRIK